MSESTVKDWDITVKEWQDTIRHDYACVIDNRRTMLDMDPETGATILVSVEVEGWTDIERERRIIAMLRANEAKGTGRIFGVALTDYPCSFFVLDGTVYRVWNGHDRVDIEGDYHEFMRRVREHKVPGFKRCRVKR